MAEWLSIIAAFVGVAIICFVIFFSLTRQRRSDTRLVAAESDSHPELLLLGDMTEILSEGMPGEQRDRAEIAPELPRAGLYGPAVLAEYRAVRAVLILTPLFAAAAICLLVEGPQIPTIALCGLVLASLGYSLPRLYIYLRAQARAREIERGLPMFADMLSIALLAGQGLIGALRRVSTQLRNSFPNMTDELEIVIRQADMLNLNVAFDQWANRSQVADVRNLAVILTQSQRLGNEVSSALMEYATNIRSGARQRADAKAQRASFWMLFPTILCLWIPAVIVLVAPMYAEFAARRAKAKELMPKLGPDGAAGSHFRPINRGPQEK
jgi:tight adherence protein C